jgi:hypothetical protein
VKDIRKYSNDELSLNVFNDSYFYNELWNVDYVIALVKEEFIYNNKQMEKLIYDIEEYKKEQDVQQALARGECQ